jgi:hypothetical protein
MANKTYYAGVMDPVLVDVLHGDGLAQSLKAVYFRQRDLAHDAVFAELGRQPDPTAIDRTSHSRNWNPAEYRTSLGYTRLMPIEALTI